MFRMHIPDGFDGQNHFVVPRYFLQQVENHPLLHALFPTDLGWYPHARYHYRERYSGTPENILIYCVAGNGWAQVGNKIYTVKVGEVLIIPSGTPHVYSASLDDPWSIHWIHFRGETAYQFMQQLDAGQYVIPIHEKAHTPIAETFQECYEALQNGFTVHQMIFCALAIHRILAWIFFANPSFQPRDLVIPKAVDKALVFMNAHLGQRLLLSEMAAHVDLSASQFSALFRLQIGVPPIEHFINLKIQAACRSLTTTTDSIKTIAYSIGYDDPSYFSRLFHKVVGVWPTDYREQQRGLLHSPHIAQSLQAKYEDAESQN